MAQVEYNKYLPSYRSLLTPNAKYDYRTHLLVELSQQDLKRIESRFQLEPPPPSKFKMKYQSLLGEVSRKALRLSMRVQLNLHPPQHTLKATKHLWLRCKLFGQLPLEIQILVFSFVDDPHAYHLCLFASKRFYQLAKPMLYRSVSFVSTYRFAQFVTCLRLNPATGTYVERLDLSGLKPGVQEEDWDDCSNPAATLAGWRDWKFKNNPLYAFHLAVLTKTVSNSSVALVPSQKKGNLAKYFKKRRRSSPPLYEKPEAPHQQAHHLLPHPTINRFLLSYSTSKDVPVGYVIHVINLCPNLVEADLGNLSLLTDYRISLPYAHKYQPYDLTHNYHKDLPKIVESILPLAQPASFNPFQETFPPTAPDSLEASSVSSVFSLNFAKPVRKYNSLLPPLPNSATEMSYLSRADGRIYLSDLNVKAINTLHLEVVHERDILRCLAARGHRVRSINLSSLIWLNAKLVADFLLEMLARDLDRKCVNGKHLWLFQGHYYDVGEPLEGRVEPSRLGLQLLDLSDLGMNKNLPWAQKIDMATPRGRQLVQRIVNDELLSSFEEYVIRERQRRGRVGENYFS